MFVWAKNCGDCCTLPLKNMQCKSIITVTKTCMILISFNWENEAVINHGVRPVWFVIFFFCTLLVNFYDCFHFVHNDPVQKWQSAKIISLIYLQIVINVSKLKARWHIMKLLILNESFCRSLMVYNNATVKW